MPVTTRSEPIVQRKPETIAVSTPRAAEMPQDNLAPAEPLAQWQDNRADRLAYLLFLAGFTVLALHVVVETLIGLLGR